MVVSFLFVSLLLWQLRFALVQLELGGGVLLCFLVLFLVGVLESVLLGLSFLVGVCRIFVSFLFICLFVSSLVCFFASLAAWFVLVQLELSNRFLLDFLLFLMLHTVQSFR